MPDPEAVEQALALIKRRAVNHSYFFSELKSPDWIGPLVDAGYFTDPPPPRANGDYVNYPVWPESRYLTRMAPVAPTRVAEVIRRIPNTDNVSVHNDLARAAIHFPARLMALWATSEADWIARQSRIEYPLNEALGTVIESLAHAGRPDAAMKLAGSLLALRWVSDSGSHGSVREPSRASDSGVERSNSESADEENREFAELAASMVARLSSRIVGRLSDYEYRQFVGHHVPILLTHGGIRVFEMLCDLLENAIESDRLRRYDGAIWRSAIEPHAQNKANGVADALIDAVRDGSMQLVDSGTGIRSVAAALGDRKATIFQRMVVHLATEQRASHPEFAVEVALSEDRFFDEELLHEYSRLLGGVFPRLDRDRKSHVLRWIGLGPTFGDSFTGGEDERRKLRLHWQARRLAWIREHLGDDWKKRHARIVEEVGEPEHPDFTSYTTSRTGPTSPLGVGGLGAMSTGEVRVRYVEALLQGLCQAVREERTVEWESILALLSEISRRYPRDREWRAARLESIKLLEAGLTEDVIPSHLRDLVWAVIDSAADDPDPSPEDDAGSAFEVASTLINTVRGNAMHAVVRYALWVRRSVMDANGRDSAEFDLNRIPEVRKRLERHLDPALDPSLSVRAVYGQWFPFLTLLDADWTEENVERIFPDRFPKLRDAAWQAYLRFCQVYIRPFRLLCGLYSAAVDRLPGSDDGAGRTRGDPEIRLGEHLLAMVGAGVLSWSDEDALVRRFFENAKPNDAQGAITGMGSVLCNQETQLPAEVLARYASLTEELLGCLEEAGRERMGHLSSLGRWIASGRFDPQWTLARLERLIRFAGTAKPYFQVMDCLVELLDDHPAETFEVFRSWVNADRVERPLLLRRSEAPRAILRKALAQPETRDEARALLDRLGAEGHLGPRDLLAAH